MDWETAQCSVDYLLAQSEGRRSVHITFSAARRCEFPMLRQVIDYASEKRPQRRQNRFQSYTNATLLTPSSSIIWPPKSRRNRQPRRTQGDE